MLSNATITLWATYFGFAAFGACLGSFVSVLVSRGPHAFGLVHDPAAPASGVSYLAGPRSYCPKCGRTLSAIDLIPVVSFLMKRARCRYCNALIARRYLAVELAAAAAGGLSLALYGLSPLAIAMVIYLCGLMALALIDQDTGFLPDAITLPLIGLGLAVSPLATTPSPAMSMAGAAIGFSSLAALAWGYRLWRGIDGLGGGDAKLLAAAGSVSGPFALPIIVLFAAGSALIVVAWGALRGKEVGLQSEVRFGPYLAMGAAAALPITQAGLIPIAW